MFDLERSISEWRRQMLAAGIKTPLTLDELESHLREDIRALLSAGKPEDQAFRLAVSRLGGPGPLRTEFKKLKKPACWPVTISSWCFIGAMILFAAYLSTRLFAGSLSLLLYAHIISITAGYGAALLAGGFGMFYVCYRLFQALSQQRQQSLDRAVLLFSQSSAGLVILGTLLAMLWCRQHYGVYLLGDVKEAGAWCVAVWFVALSLARRGRRVSERAMMLMCIVGNIIVSLAWFGAGILDYAQKHRHGTPGYWPLGLAVFLGIQIIFLVIGVAPTPAKADS